MTADMNFQYASPATNNDEIIQCPLLHQKLPLDKSYHNMSPIKRRDHSKTALATLPCLLLFLGGCKPFPFVTSLYKAHMKHTTRTRRPFVSVQLGSLQLSCQLVHLFVHRRRLIGRGGIDGVVRRRRHERRMAISIVGIGGAGRRAIGSVNGRHWPPVRRGGVRRRRRRSDAMRKHMRVVRVHDGRGRRAGGLDRRASAA